MPNKQITELKVKCEEHLDRIFPKTNYGKAVPSEGNRSGALALYGLMMAEFLAILSSKDTNHTQGE